MPNHVTNMVMSSPEVIAQLLDEQDRPDFTQVCPYPDTMAESDGRGINLLIEETVRSVFSTINDVPIDDPVLLNDFVDKRVSRVNSGNNYTVSEEDRQQFKTMLTNVKEAGFRHHMDWNLGIWDTKWNAYSHNAERSSDDRVVFDTAWSMPDGLLRELSANNVEVPVIALFADEDTGRNCGIVVYLGGCVIYDQRATVDNWGIGRIQDRWNEFAIELKGYDLDDEDMDELRQIPIMHKVFRDKPAIGHLTPQAIKLMEDSTFLTSLFNSCCNGHSGVSITYGSKGVSIDSRDYETEVTDGKFETSKYYSGEFIYVADNAIVELDKDVITAIFKEMDSHNSYTTDMNILALLFYCGHEGRNLARVLGVLVNFNSLVSSLNRPHSSLQSANDLDFIVDWMKRNRGVDINVEAELFKQFILGGASFSEWAEKASLPKPSLVPATITTATHDGMDDSRLGYEQFRVFKSICMLYCYRDIIKHNGISTIYTDTVNGVTYQVMSSKFNTITNLLLSSGVNKLR